MERESERERERERFGIELLSARLTQRRLCLSVSLPVCLSVRLSVQFTAGIPVSLR
jgi:hypothetical protein